MLPREGIMKILALIIVCSIFSFAVSGEDTKGVKKYDKDTVPWYVSITVGSSTIEREIKGEGLVKQDPADIMCVFDKEVTMSGHPTSTRFKTGKCFIKGVATKNLFSACTSKDTRVIDKDTLTVSGVQMAVKIICK